MKCKALDLKALIDLVINGEIERLKLAMNSKLQQLKKNIICMEKYEHRSKRLANKAVQFLMFFKEKPLPKAEAMWSTIQLSAVTGLSKLNVIDFFKEVQITEIGPRVVHNKQLFKLLPKAVLQKDVTVLGTSSINHISHVTPDRVWVSDDDNSFLIDTSGNILHICEHDSSSVGVHTVANAGELVYIDRDSNISKLSTDNKTKTTLIETEKLLKVYCVYCSPSTGDILVGMGKEHYDDPEVIVYFTENKVKRYKSRGEEVQTLQFNDVTGAELYDDPPLMITENRNGDVVVSIYLTGTRFGVLVVTDREGKYRFMYSGPPFPPPPSLPPNYNYFRSSVLINPRGICTDALSNIVVCDFDTNTVQVIDKDGHFLSILLTEKQGIGKPCSLSYDDINHLLWVGSVKSNKLCVFRYIDRQDYLTGPRTPKKDLALDPLWASVQPPDPLPSTGPSPLTKFLDPPL
ncbi:uncharacterized protein LOC134279515 [Saccostrea cucullata]|uniref:uncharacterized protein LOC134279515 n=1 Tax=Saccostrea cuccullata TaxID=36930 RepID=UPI002ED13E3C